MGFDSNASARWGIAVDAAAEKYQEAAKKLLTDAAARGFMSLPGQHQQHLVNAALHVKQELAKANAEIYKVRRDMLAKDDEAERKYLLKLLQIDAEAYRNALENAYRIYEAQKTASIDEYRARIERLTAETDKRQARIILERAEAERQVTYWRKIQVAAEAQSLEAEAALIRERLRTAEMKLDTLNYLGLIVEAERLVLEAEKKRTAALMRVVDASRKVAEIKKSMIPLYLEKARLREQQAGAIIKETDDRRELELLGYERVATARQKHAAEHEINLAEAVYEQAKLEYVRADRLTELCRNQVRRYLVEYQEQIRRQVIDLQTVMGMEKAGLAYRATTIKSKMDHQGDIAGYMAETQAALSEMSALSAQTRTVGEAHAETIAASALRKANHIVNRIIEKQVIRSA